MLPSFFAGAGSHWLPPAGAEGHIVWAPFQWGGCRVLRPLLMLRKLYNLAATFIPRMLTARIRHQSRETDRRLTYPPNRCLRMGLDFDCER
jgi:hypothetical protein